DESIIQFVEQYKELGYLPEALVNFLVLLGWSPEGEEEIFNKEELIQRFTLERVSKSPAVFDVDKLNWMNNHYIKGISLDQLASMCIPHLQKAGLLAEQLSPEQEEWAKAVVGLYQEQMAYG
ncbi:MAG TPA: glutamate--tRNA ligase, partial [Paenibacillaceae bacterium]|nr:glutamate--tRNA ligase [Paenibacillaceae bacterium]